MPWRYHAYGSQQASILATYNVYMYWNHCIHMLTPFMDYLMKPVVLFWSVSDIILYAFFSSIHHADGWFLERQEENRASIHKVVRQFTTKPREVSRPRDCVFRWQCRSKIWQAPWQTAETPAGRSDNSKPISFALDFMESWRKTFYCLGNGGRMCSRDTYDDFYESRDDSVA